MTSYFRLVSDSELEDRLILEKLVEVEDGDVFVFPV